jgi:hypothetical protein
VLQQPIDAPVEALGQGEDGGDGCVAGLSPQSANELGHGERRAPGPVRTGRTARAPRGVPACAMPSTTTITPSRAEMAIRACTPSHPRTTRPASLPVDQRFVAMPLSDSSAVRRGRRTALVASHTEPGPRTRPAGAPTPQPARQHGRGVTTPSVAAGVCEATELLGELWLFSRRTTSRPRLVRPRDGMWIAEVPKTVDRAGSSLPWAWQVFRGERG